MNIGQAPFAGNPVNPNSYWDAWITFAGTGTDIHETNRSPPNDNPGEPFARAVSTRRETVMSARVTVPELDRMKRSGRRIVCVTAYDYTFARLFESAGVDILLVGDSLGMVILGHDTTLPVTLDQMIHHATAVVRGSSRALVVCDMPFGVCHGAGDRVMDAAVRILKESGCQAVKLEGGRRMVETIRYLADHHIPVMAHVGLTPQSVHAFGGFKVQGRGDAAAGVLEDALAVQEAGAFAVILEGMPTPLATAITERLTIPTIGIGAGPACDGQVLVGYDLLGMFDGVRPRFVKHYLEGGQAIVSAVNRFADEVRTGAFPGPEHGFDP
ncbi:3-methyl-2-oxobutanoate hydroxymethyltransferase [Candidatus Magnetaquicoccaceae bacterium FCR-1]|uniref:3-methyl-2-oxobutanoate hydroxymethyltransferase n=2 Tax=Candidatus Magnetaquiglobus chichijimensis TaxID=3141448 RepID=A0ABQ0CD41_9PROT